MSLVLLLDTNITDLLVYRLITHAEVDASVAEVRAVHDETTSHAHVLIYYVRSLQVSIH